MFYRYKLHVADGSDAGEAHYAFLVKPGETIIAGDGRRLRVLSPSSRSTRRVAVRRAARGRSGVSVRCGNPACGTSLDEPADTAAEARQPCPRCGSTNRTFAVELAFVHRITGG